MNVATMPDHSAYFRFRSDLFGPARTRLLTGEELCEAGRLIHGRPEGFSLYGIPAQDMEAKGLRVLGRTVIECAVDAHASAAADAVAELRAELPAAREALIVDLFCGSGNVGHHLGLRLGHAGYAAELDPFVHAATRHNLDRIGSTIDLRLTDYRDLLADLAPCGPRDTYVVEPPWGPAFTAAGLDLGRTSPPIADILADIRRARAGEPCVVVIKTNDRIAHDSLAAAFAGATHLGSVTPTPTLPPGANMNFHIYHLART